MLYRIASVLLLLFAIGHTLGFRMIDPKLGVGPLIASLQTHHFQIQGFNRTFWDFYVGFGKEKHVCAERTGRIAGF